MRCSIITNERTTYRCDAFGELEFLFDLKDGLGGRDLHLKGHARQRFDIDRYMMHLSRMVKKRW